MKFNWHDESRRDRTSFKSWLVTNLISPVSRDKDQFDAISKATDKFTNVEITMQINGIEVPTEQFVDGIESNMNYLTEKSAKEQVRDMTDLVELEDAISALRFELTNKVYELANKNGIELEREEDY